MDLSLTVWSTFSLPSALIYAMNLLQKDKNKEKKRKEISKLREKGDHRSTDRKRRIHRDRPHRGSVVSDRLDLELSRPHSTPIYTKNVSSDNIKHIATSATDFSSGNVSGQRHPPTCVLEALLLRLHKHQIPTRVLPPLLIYLTLLSSVPSFKTASFRGDFIRIITTDRSSK